MYLERRAVLRVSLGLAAAFALGCQPSRGVPPAPTRGALSTRPPVLPESVRSTPAAPHAETNGPPPESAPSDPFIGLTRAEALALWNRLKGDPYELDSIERFLDEPGQKVICNPTSMLSYSGTVIPYWGPVQVSEPFVERLKRFEELVADAGMEVYGRPPRRVRHMGAYSCRKSRNRSHRVSEHALGNAIDVVGFDFGVATKEQTLPDGLPSYLRGPFEVRVKRHWLREGTPAIEAHARFLRAVTDGITERRDVFRIVIGPGHRGHSDHFHFDMSPWRYVSL